MNILVLAAEIPATSGMPGSPRLFNLCRFLSKNHRLSLITGCQLKERRQWFFDDPCASNVFQEITILPDAPHPTWWNKQRHRFHLAPHFLTRYRSPDYYQRVLNIISEKMSTMRGVDLIYVDRLEMTQYVEKNREAPIIVDLHDSLTLLFGRLGIVEKQLFRKLAIHLEKFSVARQERAMGKYCSLIVANSRADEAMIKKLVPSGHTLTVANGVDTDYFAPAPHLPNDNKLIFTGVMDYGPNEDAVLHFCTEIFPFVKKEFPNIEFWVVGANPSSAVQSLTCIPGVHVTGWVNDIRLHLQTASMFVCPLRSGAGIKNKILAAMAMRKPIVATPLSLEGIEARPGEEVLLAESKEDFVKSIGSLLTNKPLSQRLGENGYRLVKEKYSWIAKGQIIESTLKDVVANYSRQKNRNFGDVQR